MPVMTRADLQATAQEKIDDAVHLLAAGRFSNAYYLAGYAVEIGLKACIARTFISDAIPDRKFVQDIHVHDLPKLVGLAGLNADLRRLLSSNTRFSSHWGHVVRWSPETRYTGSDAAAARSLIDAVSDGNDGVLSWIRTVW